MPRQSQAAKRRRDLSAWRIASYFFDGWPHTADAATVPSREAAQGSVGMADCFILFAMHKLSLYSLNIKEKAAAYATALLRGTDGARTHDLPHVKRTLIPAELRFHILLILRKGQWNRRGSNP